MGQQTDGPPQHHHARENGLEPEPLDHQLHRKFRSQKAEQLNRGPLIQGKQRPPLRTRDTHVIVVIRGHLQVSEQVIRQRVREVAPIELQAEKLLPIKIECSTVKDTKRNHYQTDPAQQVQIRLANHTRLLFRRPFRRGIPSVLPFVRFMRWEGTRKVIPSHARLLEVGIILIDAELR